MIYMGIDASTTATGWCIFDDCKLLNYGVIKPKSKDWRERIGLIMSELHNIIKEYKPIKIYCEDVPLKDGKLTIIKLGAVQGGIIFVSHMNNVESEFIPVSAWRQKMLMFDGTQKGMKRDEMKKKSIEIANSKFDLELKSDDISDAILIAYSQINHQ